MASPPHFDPWLKDDARTKRLRAVMERYRLNLLAADLASSDINLASPSPDVVAFSVDAYRRLAARCAELGAASLCVGSGRRHALLDKANERLLESFRPAFRAIVEEARREGLTVSIENHPQGLLADAPAICRFIDEEGYEDVGVIYDVANAAAIGEDPVEGLAMLASHLRIVHLSDSPPGQRRHDPIGSGAIDFARIAAALGRQAYAGPVAIEILSQAPLVDLTEAIGRLELAEWRFVQPFERSHSASAAR